MTKKYQKNAPKTSALAVPEQVSVAMTQIAEEMREGLLALAVGAGLQVMGQLMEADVTAVCGPRGKHNPERAANRHGTEAGSVTLGGRRVPVERPRVRAAGGSGEVAVPSYELFTSTEILGKMAMEKMLAGPAEDHRIHRYLRELGNTVSLRVAPGREPAEHPLHRHPAEQLGAVEQLVGRHRQFAGAVGGTDPGSGHPNPAATQGDRATLGAVPVRGTIRVVLATRPAHCGHVGLHQLLHHLQPCADREGQQPLAHVGGDLAHRHAHLLGHGERVRVAGLGLVPLVHGGPLSPWVVFGGRPTPTARQASGGDRHLNFHESRDNLERTPGRLLFGPVSVCVSGT